MFFTNNTVFKGIGNDRIRIPTITISANGTVYAFANNRVGSANDDVAEAEIVVNIKKPGEDWSGQRVIAARKDWSYVVCDCITDEVTDNVMCIFRKSSVVQNEFAKSLTPEQRSALAREREERDGDREGHYILELKDGEFIERRINIAPYTGSDAAIPCAGTPHGSGAGITLKNGKYAGRLICPARMTLHEVKTWADLETGSTNTVIYSDDRGITWKTGGVVEPGTGEGTLAERSDGSIYFNSRAYFGHRLWLGDGYRRSAVSFDGGDTFVSQRKCEDLIEPCCNAAVLAFEENGKKIMLFSNPRSTDKRIDMSVYMSLDEGESWSFKKTVDSRFSSYSSMCYDKRQGHVFLLYECGEKAYSDSICCAEFDLDYIMN